MRSYNKNNEERPLLFERTFLHDTDLICLMKKCTNITHIMSLSHTAQFLLVACQLLRISRIPSWTTGLVIYRPRLPSSLTSPMSPLHKVSDYLNFSSLNIVTDTDNRNEALHCSIHLLFKARRRSI